MAEVGRGGGSDLHDRHASSGSDDSIGGDAYVGDGGGGRANGHGTWRMGDSGGLYSGGVPGGSCLDLADLSFCA